MTTAWHSIVGRVAGGISLLAFLPYVVAILRRQARPHRATWLIWSAVGAVLFASYDASAGGAARWVPLSDAVGPATIAVLSLRYGIGGFSRFDLGCSALAAASLVAWAFTGSPMVALAINLFVDLLGALPTLRKAYRDPGSESVLTWRIFLLCNVLNLAAIERWTVASALYPLYVVVISGLVNALLAVALKARGR